MSDDEGSGSSSSSSEDNLSTTGLIATRAKRSTAGNLYATLRANLDDEDLQRDLLAEDEEGEDAGDYEGSVDGERGGGDGDGDEDDDDAELESSSDEEEDAGPPKEGEVEDLEGEKALKKLERAELKRKRKTKEARLKLPAWRKKSNKNAPEAQHPRKRVKLADDVKTEDGNSSERPRKKSERSNWLPSSADAPIRQSARASAVANREITHANLRQSAVRSEHQRKVMKHAAEREKSKRWMDLSQEERLKKCERIERETAKELGRWEREEAERQRLREEALAAKRKRGIDGPVYRMWSGSVLWVGEKIRVRRLEHGSQDVEEIKLPSESEEKKFVPMIGWPEDLKPSMAAHTMLYFEDTPDQSLMEVDEQPEEKRQSVDMTDAADFSWLPGIHEHAAQADSMAVDIAAQAPHGNTATYTPSAPSIHVPPMVPDPTPAQLPTEAQPAQATPTHVSNGGLPGTHTFAIQPNPAQQPQQPAPPPPPPVPQVREQAQRSLMLLENFDNLPSANSFATTSRRSRASAKDTSHLESDPLKDVLLPGAYPSFNVDETKYLLSKHKKKAGEHYLVPPPGSTTKSRCALTSWPAKYRDPKTGLAYADYHQYRTIRRMLAGGIQWSVLLGCWVGPAYGAMGRPARGVPDAFAGIERPPVPSSTTQAANAEAGQDVKAEKAAS